MGQDQSTQPKPNCETCKDLVWTYECNEYQKFTPDCPGCALVLAIVAPYKDSIRETSDIALSKRSHSLVLTINPDDDEQDRVRLEAFTNEGDQRPWESIDVAPEISGNTASDLALEWVRRQLADCEDAEKHQYCPRETDPKLPTRVLEIVGPEHVRLLVTSGEGGRYCALSHCWGGRQPIRTTAATIERFREVIPWNDLPQTFQDAVSFTYRLGVKYLWVDSLCIIQDDIDDWRSEGGKMSDIYTNSYLTLCASKAKNATEGCYSVSSPAHQSHPLSIIHPIHGEYDIRVRERLSHTHWLQDYYAEPDQLPLLRRAWGFQELLLSPRVLHFTHNELVWECRSHQECECGGVRDEFDSRFEKSYYGIPEGDYDSMLEKWRDVIGEYTRREATYETDIFPALQGMAKYFHGLRKREYYAGLWQDNLIADLLWSKFYGGDCTTWKDRPTSWRAPTWSWGSVTGAVKLKLGALSDEGDVRVATAVAHTTPVDKDPFGELKAATLTLTAPCIDAILSWEGESAEWGPDFPDFTFDFLLPDGGMERMREEDRSLWPDYRYDVPGPYAFESGAKVRIVWMAVCDDGKEWDCLVLRCVDRERDVYERIGILDYYFRDEAAESDNTEDRDADDEDEEGEDVRSDEAEGEDKEAEDKEAEDEEAEDKEAEDEEAEDKEAEDKEAERNVGESSDAEGEDVDGNSTKGGDTGEDVSEPGVFFDGAEERTFEVV